MPLENKKNHSVSVVIPTYNRSLLLSRAIQSVCEQTELPLEIIVLDDASTDDTLMMLEEFKKISLVPINIFSSEINIGPAKLRNIGLEMAAGDYVAFLDSDDVWTANKLKTFSHDLSNNTDIAIWTHRFASFGRDEVLTEVVKVIPYWKQLLKNHASCPCTIIKKDIGERFSEDMKYNEDHELFSRISYSHPLYLNQSVLTLLNREVNVKGGLSGSIWKMRLGELKTYFKATSYCPQIVILLPFLVVYSSLKHLRLLFRGL